MIVRGILAGRCCVSKKDCHSLDSLSVELTLDDINKDIEINVDIYEYNYKYRSFRQSLNHLSSYPPSSNMEKVLQDTDAQKFYSFFQNRRGKFRYRKGEN